MASFVAWLLSAALSTAQEEIQIVHLAALTRWSGGIAMNEAARLLAERINSNTELLPNYKLVLKTVDTGCSAVAEDVVQKLLLNGIVTVHNYRSFSNFTILDEDLGHFGNSSYVGFIGTSCSSGALKVTKIAAWSHKPMISPGARSEELSDRSKHPYFWRTTNSMYIEMVHYFSIAALFGVSKVACFFTDQSESLVRGFADGARRTGIATVGQLVSETTAGATWQLADPDFKGFIFHDTRMETAESLTSQFLKYPARVSFLLLHPDNVRRLLCAFHERGIRGSIFFFSGSYKDSLHKISDDVLASDHIPCTASNVLAMMRDMLFVGSHQARVDRNVNPSSAPCYGDDPLSFYEEFLTAVTDSEGRVGEGYEWGSPTADALCMWALALHEMLEIRKSPLSVLRNMNEATFLHIQSLFGITDFEGITGRVRFMMQDDPTGLPGPDQFGVQYLIQLSLSMAERKATLPNAQLFPLATLSTDTDGSMKITWATDPLKFSFTWDNTSFHVKGHSLTGFVNDFPTCEDGSVFDFVSRSCKSCHRGTYYDTEFGVCRDCVAGFFGTIDSDAVSRCNLCPAGAFNEIRGASTCALCEPGQYQSIVGQSECLFCETGRFSSREGSNECLRCEIGFVASAEGATACDVCPIEGSLTVFQGAASIDDCTCPTGHFLHERTRRCIPFFTLGMLLPFTHKPHYLPVISLLELDVQANINKSGHLGLTSPIVTISNISEFLRLQVYARNTNADGFLAAKGFVELSGGQRSYTEVHGVVGAYYSRISIRAADLSKSFKTILLSHSSTSRELSNKELYPFFLRTIPSDAYTGKAFLAYFVGFGFASFALLYDPDDYGVYFYNVVRDEARLHQVFDGQWLSYRLPIINNVVDYSESLQVVRRTKQIGARLWAFAVHATSTLTLQRVLSDSGVWAPDYHFFWSDVFGITNGNFPLGSHTFFMDCDSGSARQSLFRLAWSQLKLEHYAGTASKSRWHVDAWDPAGGVFNSSLIKEAWAQQEDELDPYVYFLFDACYSFIHAYNHLLRQGVEPQNVQINLLLKALKRIEFDGITGRVSFSQTGDRIMNYSLLNAQSIIGKQAWVPVASYDTVANNLVLWNLSLWMDRSRSLRTPEHLRGCQEGFVEDALSGCRRTPDSTDCSPGQGVIDANGIFLESYNTALAVQCRSCAAGTTSLNINETDQYAYVCSKCVSGRFQKQIGSTKPCEACEAGEEVNIDQSGCNVCSVGKSTTNGSCTDCSEGQYAPLRSGQCLVCESGKTVNKDQSACEFCPGGTSSTSGTCELCPEGKYAPVGSAQCSNCALGHKVTFDQQACEAWWHVPIIIAASLPIAIILARYLQRWCVAKFRDSVQRRRYRNRRHKTVQRDMDGTIISVGGHHLKFGLTLPKISEVLAEFPNVMDFRQQEVHEKNLGWLRTQGFFDPEIPCPNSYELCEMAKGYVDQKNMHDYSIAEICYVENDKGVGLVTVFVSHYQAEWIEETLACMLSFERRKPGSIFFFDVFSIRQNVKGDFNVDLVQDLITWIGTTLMVAHPWKSPATLKRIWCVFEVLCTIEGKANLNVAIVENEDLAAMQFDAAHHESLYENVLDAIKHVRVERAEAKNESDRTKIMDTIRAGPGFLKTNLAVAAALTSAIERELTRASTSKRDFARLVLGRKLGPEEAPTKLGIFAGITNNPIDCELPQCPTIIEEAIAVRRFHEL